MEFEVFLPSLARPFGESSRDPKCTAFIVGGEPVELFSFVPTELRKPRFFVPSPQLVEVRHVSGQRRCRRRVRLAIDQLRIRASRFAVYLSKDMIKQRSEFFTPIPRRGNGELTLPFPSYSPINPFSLAIGKLSAFYAGS